MISLNIDIIYTNMLLKKAVIFYKMWISVS